MMRLGPIRITLIVIPASRSYNEINVGTALMTLVRAKAGIQVFNLFSKMIYSLDSRLRGNDGLFLTGYSDRLLTKFIKPLLRKRGALILVFNLVLMIGCKRTIDISSKTASGVSGPSIYDGTWNGTTSQQLSFRLTVSNSVITNASYSLRCAPEDFPWSIGTTFSAIYLVNASGRFNIPNDFGLSISGQFNTSTSGTGSLSDFVPGCPDTVTVSWTATKT